MTFESDGVASLQWVGTVPAARGAGLGAYRHDARHQPGLRPGRVVVHAAGLADGRTDLPRPRLRDDLALRRVRALAPPAGALSGVRAACSEAEQPARVGGLPEVLEAVVGDADEAHAQGDRRVPAAVHHPVEVVGTRGSRGSHTCGRRPRPGSRAARRRSRAERRRRPRVRGRSPCWRGRARARSVAPSRRWSRPARCRAARPRGGPARVPCARRASRWCWHRVLAPGRAGPG